MEQQENNKIMDEKLKEKPTEEIKRKHKMWSLVPSLVWNIDKVEVTCGTLFEVLYKKLIKDAKFIIVHFIMIFIYLILAVLLVVIIGIITRDCGIYAYFELLIFSFFLIYLNDDSNFKEELKIRFNVQNQLIRICEIYNIKNQYSGDIEKGFLGAEMPLITGLAFIPFKAILFTAYAIIIFLEQLSNIGFSVEWLNNLLVNSYGIKYIVIIFLAIDRASIQLKNKIKEMMTLLNISNKKYISIYEPVFLESHFYLLDSYMTELTKGNILIAVIDEQSLAYQMGIRQYDIIISINNEKSRIDILQSELRKWRNKKNTLILGIVTSESDYKISKNVKFEGA